MNAESHNTIGDAGESKAVLTPLPVAAAIRHELHHMRQHWFWFFALGVSLLVGGFLAIVYPVITSVAAAGVLSIVLMAAGVATILGAFWSGKWGGFLVHMLVGILYLMAGVVVSNQPVVTIQAVTLVVAVLFMVAGMFRVLASMTIRFPQWGWSLLNGCITFLVGVAIFRDLKDGALWVIGLLVGIELIFSGVAWLMLALDIRRIKDVPDTY